MKIKGSTVNGSINRIGDTAKSMSPQYDWSTDFVFSSDIKTWQLARHKRNKLKKSGEPVPPESFSE